jgi:hypothetical protein
MIQTINYAITKIFDVILYPFSFINDFWGILFLSIVSSVVVLVIYKYVSSPRLIRRAKNQIKSSILSIRLYKDFWRVIVSSFGKSLAYTLKYFVLNFGPILLIIPILLPVFAQMDVRYGMHPFEEGEMFVVKAKFNRSIEDLDVRLLANRHIEPVMNPVFIKALNEVNWKLKVVNGETTTLEIEVGDRVVKKILFTGDYRGAISNKKLSRSQLDHFIYPVEDLLPQDSPLEYIYIRHPGKLVSFLGTRIHWIIHYLVLVLIIVLALRKRFNVEF